MSVEEKKNALKFYLMCNYMTVGNFFTADFMNMTYKVAFVNNWKDWWNEGLYNLGSRECKKRCGWQQVIYLNEWQNNSHKYREIVKRKKTSKDWKFYWTMITPMSWKNRTWQKNRNGTDEAFLQKVSKSTIIWTQLILMALNDWLSSKWSFWSDFNPINELHVMGIFGTS